MRKAIVPLAGLACLALTTAAQAAPPPGAPACSVFPANNVWTPAAGQPQQRAVAGQRRHATRRRLFQ